MLEKSLLVFHTERKASFPDAPLEEMIKRLNGFLTDIGIKSGAIAFNASNFGETLKKDSCFFHPEYCDNREIHNDIKNIANALIGTCHKNESLNSPFQTNLFVEKRQKITVAVNTYENRVNRFIDVDTITPEHKLEAQRHLKKVSLWRDGVINHLPIYPKIEGFPLPIGLEEELGEHPLLQKVHHISHTLHDYAKVHNLTVTVEPLQVLESGQKSLGRIIEKAYSKKQMPSKLHDLARAMFLTKDIEDIQRFNELYQQKLQDINKLGDNKVTDIKHEEWSMKETGYSDTKTTAMLSIDGTPLYIESQAKLPEERRAEMKSHRIYEFTRGELKEAWNNSEDHTKVLQALKTYNAFATTF